MLHVVRVCGIYMYLEDCVKSVMANLAIRLILRGDAVISVAKEDEGSQPTAAKNTSKDVVGIAFLSINAT